jgi:serine/threonine protein kinase
MSELPRTGETFGRYRILGQLGRGGMGVVLRALQVDLHREVALKLLPADLADQDEFAQRFRREATLLASVDSPHIIAVYDHGELDGRLFIATQLIRGGDLGELLARSGPPPLVEGLEIVAQLASALADAHEAGVVHRDVKPGNVLLRREDAGWHAYLCDFGIAHAGDTGLTNAGVVVGTFGYLAPERCEGAPATAASDIYALGCLLVAVVTGTAPYAGSDFQVAQQHVSSAVPQWDPTFVGAEDLNRILAVSMAKRPEDRYSSARDLRHDVLSAARRIGQAQSRPSQAPALQATVLRPMQPPDKAAPDPQHTAAPSAPRRHSSTKLAAAAVAAVLAIMAMGAAGYAAFRPGHDDSRTAALTAPGSSPETPTSSSASPSAAARRQEARQPTAPIQTKTVVAAPEPAAFSRSDLPCSGEQYVVVLASVLDASSTFSAVEQVLEKFDNPDYVPRYAVASESCENLTRINNASSAAWIPYLGPFEDAASACQARVAVADTSTYIAQVSDQSTSKVFCACSFAGPELPDLSRAADQTPSHDHSFWVLELQSMLKKADYTPPEFEGGNYGPQTTEWVKDLQGDFGLPPTGTVDSDTWEAVKVSACD